MKIKNVGSNMTEVDFGAVRVLVSYETPVACYVDGEGYYKTEKKFSSTTSKHINKWLDGAATSLKPQDFFTGLLVMGGVNDALKSATPGSIKTGGF